MQLLAAVKDPAVIVPVMLLFAALVIANLVWTLNRSAAMLERHLRDRGYRLVRREYRWLARGPFFWTTSKGQAVYRFTAEDTDGDRKEGWARVGGFFFGLLTTRVDVRWDDEPRDRGGPGFPVVMPDDTRSR